MKKVSPTAFKLWTLFKVGIGGCLTLRDISRTLGISKAKTKQAIMELEGVGALTIMEGR